MNDDGARFGRSGSSLSRSEWMKWRTLLSAGRARPGPQRLGDLLGVDDAVALADQVLEDVPGPLLQPLAAQRAPRGCPRACGRTPRSAAAGR